MRFLMMVKANEESEGGAMPDDAAIAEMTKFNEKLAKAGVLLDLAGLHPTSRGALVTFASGKPAVTDGPFGEAKELVAGYWVIQVKSLEEATEWAKRVPFQEGEIEIRQLSELDEFGSGEGVERARKLEEKLAKKK
jgi:hypothetical protein